MTDHDNEGGAVYSKINGKDLRKAKKKDEKKPLSEDEGEPVDGK